MTAAAASTGRFSTAHGASVVLALALDLIAFAALAATAEIRLGVFLLALGLMATAAALGGRRGSMLRGWPLVLIYVALVIAALFAWKSLRMAPVVVAGHVAPLAHALIWFATDSPRNRSWRLGMGFVELVIASALTPEFYLPFAIIAFVVIGSVALSCNFLETELKQAEGGAPATLPRAYIRNSIVLSFGIFLTSALIFPILPRTQVGGGLAGPAQTGYTEEVRVNELTQFSSTQSSRALLRIWTEPASDFLTSIHLNLLRGKVLDLFDGDRWFASRTSNAIRPSRPFAQPDATSVTLEMSKEPLQSPILPIPYGAVATWVLSPGGETFVPARTGRSRQWIDFGTAYSNARYRVRLAESEVYGGEGDATDGDLPIAQHLAIPPAFDTRRMRRLSEQVFGTARRSGDKISRLRDWFAREKFTAIGPGVPIDADANAIATRFNAEKLLPLELFLMVTRQGHCELFASSAALLLRLAGVPTRLIAGFRIARGPFGGTLTVRSSDAHAWLEAWSDERKRWIPLDLTPRAIAPSLFVESFRDAYDFLSAYWSRYVVGYSSGSDESARDLSWNRFRQRVAALATSGGELKRGVAWILGASPLVWLGAILGIALGVAFALLAIRFWAPTLFSIRWRVREGPRALRAERLRMEAGVRKRLRRGALSEAASRKHAEWLDGYRAARFGRPDSAPALQELAELRREFAKIA